MDEHLPFERRPSPEALLREAAQESRGHLKIFLGAAPGVGKTYEMLQAAQAKRRDGIDVVIGLVETHSRRETDALLAGLEIVPRRQVDYRGHRLSEMDLDAVLVRKPQLVLVDELAHSNAAGGRHPKRYLDVEELLAAGIDVYTTLNIQHVESLNDVVARITRIRVHETVPDSIIDRADEIEVVDLTPDDLIQRLKEGKVYVPAQAERAVRHYFQPGNLTALRELALRRTAQRVDAQMVDYMRAHAISGPWAAGERVLVGVNQDPSCTTVVRYARRLADRLQAPWLAIHIETAQSQRLTTVERDRIAECLRLAERLGGEAVTMPGTNVVDGILEYAQANNSTHLVIAKSHRPRWSEWLRGSVTHKLIRQAGDISVHVIAARPDMPEGREPLLRSARERSWWGKPDAYLASAGFVAVALAVGVLLQQFLAISNIALVFLTAVLTSAATYGLLPSLFACLLSVLAYNFFSCRRFTHSRSPIRRTSSR